MCSVVETLMNDFPESGVFASWEVYSSDSGEKMISHCPLPSLNLEADSLLLSTKLLLADEFEEITTQSCNSLKLYLTDTELVVASKTFNCTGKEDKSQLKHVRTHLLKDICVSQDPNNSDTLKVKTLDGEVFLYKMKQGATGISFWLARIFHLKRTSVSPTSTDSTCDDRLNPTKSLPSAQMFQSIPVLNIHQPSLEWHGETFQQYPSLSPSPELENSLKISQNGLHFSHSVQSLKSNSLERRVLPLKRREAFRVPDKESFHRWYSERLRSSSAPPDKQKNTPSNIPTSPISHFSSSSDNLLSPVSPLRKLEESTLPQSSLRKKKLNFSPQARKFTRALSARLMNTGINSSPKHSSKKEFCHHLSFQENHSSSLPRSLKSAKKERKKKGRSVTYLVSTPEPQVPMTPTKPKSPGSLLKLFHRKWASSTTFKLDDVLSPSEDLIDGEEIDLHNRPNHLKLYVQNPKEIAEELALMDAEIFRSIDLSELYNEAWTKKTKYSTSPNVLRMIESFNQLARIVCTEIVHEKTLHSRAKAISSYIQLAGKCYQLRNYNSMKAIVSGLQSQAVYRLTRSWNHVSSRRRKKLEKYSQLLSEFDNDEHLKKEMMYNLSHDIQCVPYLGWLLTFLIHRQTYYKLQDASRGGATLHRRSVSMREGNENKRKSWRESSCSLSLPSSPVHKIKMDDIEKMHEFQITTIGGSPVIKSLSDTNVLDSTQHETSFIGPQSLPQPLIPQRLSVSDKAPSTIPMTTEFKQSSFEHESSSDSSIDDHSAQNDSAIGLDSSIGHSTPERDSKMNKENDHTIQFSNKPSQFSLDDTEDYFLPPVDSNFESESDDDDVIDGPVNFEEPSSISSSRSPSPFLSPSVISLSIVSESTPIANEKRRVTLPEQSLNTIKPAIKRNSCSYYDFPFGILFSSCSLQNSDCSILEIQETEATLAAVAQELQVQSQNDDQVVSETDVLQLDHVTPVIDSDTEQQMPIQSEDKTHEESINNSCHNSDQQGLSDISGLHLSPENGRTTTTTTPPVVVFDIFKQYQFNALKYSCNMNSRNKLRNFINDIPWVDENKCYSISLKMEPNC